MLKPVDDKVVVKVIDEKEKTSSSGLILTSLSDEKSNEAYVVAVGPGLRLPNGDIIVPDVNIGDKVVFAKYQGTEIEHDGDKFLILAYRDIVAILEETNDNNN
jgi:chaperonin GroES